MSSANGLFQRHKKVIIPIAILVGAIIAAKVIMNNPPTADRFRPSQAPQMTVGVQALQPQVFQVEIASYGTVQPRTQSMLVAQASGQIQYVSEHFRDGGFFNKGEVLLKLDDRDAKADVNIARANFLDAKQALAEEQAKADQALLDWQRLGKTGTPNDLVLRKPQLAAAEARMLSSQAQLSKAELALERTQIVAPYDGRVLNKMVDLGQVVSNNSQLASIYATDYVEIRLPIKNQDLGFVDVPEEYRNTSTDNANLPTVLFRSAMGQQTWQGSLVRTEGAIDENAQQLYVVAQIDDPFGKANAGRQAIKIGQYVSATIEGKLLSDALVIPTKAVYQGSYVYIVQEGVLLRKPVELLWKNTELAVVKSGLNAGDNLVITALGQVSSGTRVAIDGQRSAQGGGKATAATGDKS